MNFVAQVEEHLRDLGAEARKKHPGVKEASERAILQLRTLQNSYVTAVRKASQASGGQHPTTALFQSQDLLRPFLLAANYPNASPELLDISLRGMSLLIKGNAICPGDGIHMVRVWTIQANVCASTLSTEKKATPNTGSSSSSSSWFGMLSSSTSDVSSSGRQGIPQRKESSEKLALEILRCLVLLLENKHLPVTDEQWTASVALSCILGHLKVMVVQQAAKASLHQVLSLLFKSNHDHSIETWRDLLILASQERTSLRGAFSQCKSSAPSPTLCLELVCQVARGNTEWFQDNIEEIEMESMQVATALLQNTKSISFELVWRSYDFASVMLVTSLECDDSNDHDEIGDKDSKDKLDEEASLEPDSEIEDEELRELDECREQLIAALVKGISRATEICRNNDDFEDGYVYTGEVTQTKPNKPLVTLVPDSLLWRAGLALETLSVVLGRNPKCVVSVVEAVSDFATICASCRDHMLQLVSCSQKSGIVANDTHDDGDNSIVLPSLFRRAEEIQSAALTSQKTSENAKNLPSTSCSVGDTLWIAFHCLLETSRYVDEETSFAPLLAILQHFLKRFPGSREIVHYTLVGYNRLAHIIKTGNELQRKALVSSLCKLSLPSWGIHDSATLLQDHNIEALICMLRIVHKYRDNIMSEWYMVLWTLEELSTLSTSSPKLSDDGYKSALIVSDLYSRIAPLTTILSLESLSAVMEALIEIAQSPKTGRGTVSAEKLERTGLEDERLDKKGITKDEGSIGGKFISFAGKAILGSEKAENGNGSENQDMVAPIKLQRVKETYGEKYRQELLKRLTVARALRGELLANVPFSLLIMTDICLSNTFRFKTCGSIISSDLCKLAGSSEEARAYAMEALSFLIKSQLLEEKEIPAAFVGPAELVTEDPLRTQLFEVVAEKRTTEPDSSISQVDLLQPLCSTIKSTKEAGVAEAGISSLHSLLEGAGHNLNGKVWAIVIDAVSSVAGESSYHIDRTGSDWSTSCMLGFRCLKLIVDDFLEELPPPSDDSSIAPRKALMECCLSYGSSRHDVNTSLTAIGLLWTIADQDADASSIERALAKLVVLAGDCRTEVRNCAVNSLFSCIVGRGQNFTIDQWERCITDTVFGVYDQVLYRGGESNNQQDSPINDNSIKYKTSVHHSRDSADKQWATTEVLVLSGLVRVLRNNFNQLLQTTGNVRVVVGQSSTCVSKPWFVSAWSRILELALNAAKQTGGRETIDLRSTGADLMILCCQLSCRAGIQAALTPARVGTNMQVVNGALRSVGEAKGSKTQVQPTAQELVPESVKLYREELFKVGFDTLSLFQKHLEEAEKEVEESKPYHEPVQVQVLHRLAGGLGKLYECCKDGELSPNHDKIQCRIATARFLALESEGADADDFETRFVDLVGIVAKKAVSAQARFLTQAQRSAMDLLKEMVENGSNQSLKAVASMAGPAFFWSTEEESGSSSVDDGFGIETLAREAAIVVSDQIKNEKILDESKAQVLCMLLSVFVVESDKESWKLESKVAKEPGRKRNYKLFIPVMEEGLASAKRLDASDEATSSDLLDLLWERVDMVLSQMLSPIYIASHAPYVSQASNLAELIKAVVAFVQNERQNEVAALLSSGALKSVDIARDHSAYEIEDPKEDGKIRSKKRYDEALKICRECMIGLCRLQPKSSMLESIAAQVFEDLITALGDENEKHSHIKSTNIQIASITCQAIKVSNDMDSLVLSLFPKLCFLISVDHTELRTEVATIMKTVNIGETITDARNRMEKAEQEASEATSENESLKIAIEELQEENNRLQHQIAVFSSSSALT